MPLPPHIISVSLFLCEKVLQEKDDVLSAIRIVDIFGVPDLTLMPPEVKPHVRAIGCLLIKAAPGSYLHMVQFKVQKGIDGEKAALGEPFELKLKNAPGMESIPTGAMFNAELNFLVTTTGTNYLSAFIDGEEVARTPFTIWQQQEPAH